MSNPDLLAGARYGARFLISTKQAGREETVSKLDEIKFDVATNVIRTNGVTRLIERIEELEQELERERVRLAGCSAAALGYGEPVSPGSYRHSASYDDVMGLYAKVQRYRELAEMVDEFLTRYPFSGKLAINIKTMTRELLKADKSEGGE